MNDYVTEKEQIQQIKDWWNKSGKWLAVAVVIGLCIGLAYRYWRRHETQASMQASQYYQMMMTAKLQKNTKAMQGFAQKLMDDYDETAYAAFAAFTLAQNDVKAKNYKIAYTNLDWAISHANTASLKQIARIRAARVLLAMNQPKQAMDVLKTVNDKTFMPLIENVRGNIYQAQGFTQAATKAYQAAKDGYAGVGADNPVLNLQLTS